MYSWIKGSICTIYASKLIESIKVLYTLLAFLSVSLIAMYSLGIFGGMPKIVGILG